MDIVSTVDEYETIKFSMEDEIAFIQIYRPNANNSINQRLVDEIKDVLDRYEEEIKIIVLEGLPEVFCFGADFNEMRSDVENNRPIKRNNPESIYNLWLRIATGPFISIAHVRGKVNAGGMGFVSSCDLVLSSNNVTFALSELLFGLIPACVLPFLIRRVGFIRANYMTLMTHPVTLTQALEWGLVDAYSENSTDLLRKHLLRVRRLSKITIKRYKTFTNKLSDALRESQTVAIDTNIEVFSDITNRQNIARYVETGLFPWQR